MIFAANAPTTGKHKLKHKKACRNPIPFETHAAGIPRLFTFTFDPISTAAPNMFPVKDECQFYDKEPPKDSLGTQLGSIQLK